MLVFYVLANSTTTMATATAASSTAGTASPTVAPTVGASDNDAALSTANVVIIAVVVVVVAAAAVGLVVFKHVKRNKGFRRGTVSPNKQDSVKPAWDAPPAKSLA
jgi:heme/copper-type cytochrome/quinol oxidase subunit 2